MRTQKGDNTSVVAIHGNFDDAQTGVKKLFGNKELEKEMAEAGFPVFPLQTLSNIGRLVPTGSFIMYMHMQNCWKMSRSRTEKRSTL